MWREMRKMVEDEELDQKYLWAWFSAMAHFGLDP